MKRFLIVIFVLVFAASALAQRPRHKRHVTKEPEQPHMDSAKQSEQMKKMTDTFVGMWKTAATVEKGPMFTRSGTAEGRSDFRSGPGGNSLIERARSHGVMGLFAGMGVFWWDPVAASYKAMWCDSLAPEGCDVLGNGMWDANGLVFTAQATVGQNTIHLKATYSNIAADSFTYTLQMGTDDAPLTTMMTVRYQREQPRTTVVTPSGSELATPLPVTPPQQ